MLTKFMECDIFIIVNEREVIIMGHNIWFVISLMVLVFVAPFGAINHLIALAAIGIAGVFFFIWYLREMEEEEKMFDK